MKELANIKQRETFDFDEAFAASMSIDEAREQSKNFQNLCLGKASIIISNDV